MVSAWSRVDVRVRRRLRAMVLAVHGPVCHLCGEAIDLSLPRRHPGCFTVDHLVPPRIAPERLLDPNNLRPAHYGCNAGKKDRTRPSVPAVPFEPRLDW